MHQGFLYMNACTMRWKWQKNTAGRWHSQWYSKVMESRLQLESLVRKYMVDYMYTPFQVVEILNCAVLPKTEILHISGSVCRMKSIYRHPCLRGFLIENAIKTWYQIFPHWLTYRMLLWYISCWNGRPA